MIGFGRGAFLVTLSLTVLMISVAPVMAQAGEQKVSIDQVPARVKAAVLKLVGDGKLFDIGVLTDGDKKTYEIEMVVEGNEYDVLLASDGSVLRKTSEGRKTSTEKAPGKKAGAKADAKPGKGTGEFQDRFHLESRQFASTGRNRFFVLEPGYQLVLEGKEGEHTVKLEITVLEETKKIGNILTRVVEERETADGELIEISRNFFAICKQTMSVFYFGEEVDIYKDGKIVGHEGAWLHGENGARAGLMMPGDAILGAAYYQEVAPKVAMDRAKIVDVDKTLETPAGVFKHCLKIQEENPLDKGREFKIHAPEIGLVQDEDLLLVKHGFVRK